jgi:hypothetical protein
MKKEIIENLIKKWMGFIPKRNVPSIFEQKVNIKTTMPEQQLNFNDWAQILHVSQLYRK